MVYWIMSHQVAFYENASYSSTRSIQFQMNVVNEYVSISFYFLKDEFFRISSFIHYLSDKSLSIFDEMPKTNISHELGG